MINIDKTTLKVTVDGQNAGGADLKAGILVPDGDRLYRLHTGGAPRPGLLRIQTDGPVRFLAFTFG